MKYFNKSFCDKNNVEFIGIYKTEYKAEIEDIGPGNFYKYVAFAEYVIDTQKWTMIKMRDPNEIIEALLKLE